MGIVKWAAVAVTLLMAVANVGMVAQDHLGLKLLGLALGTAAATAVFGVATERQWGWNALIGVGAVNLAAALVGALVGMEGWPVGVVLSGLAIVLAGAARPSPSSVVVP